jgi:hypothetical protein
MAKDLCINHTSSAAVTRCFSCHKPLCERCVIKEGNGNFCSQHCAVNYAKFAHLSGPSGPGFFGKLKNLIVTIIFLALAAVIVVFAGAKFLKIGFCESILKMFGL